MIGLPWMEPNIIGILLIETMKKLSLAVVGGGPAGFYLARQLSKLPKQPLVHIFEKEYCPFGLIRYGVAPDHISIKKSETTLASIHSY